MSGQLRKAWIVPYLADDKKVNNPRAQVLRCNRQIQESLGGHSAYVSDGTNKVEARISGPAFAAFRSDQPHSSIVGSIIIITSYRKETTVDKTAFVLIIEDFKIFGAENAETMGHPIDVVECANVQLALHRQRTQNDRASREKLLTYDDCHIPADQQAALDRPSAWGLDTLSPTLTANSSGESKDEEHAEDQDFYHSQPGLMMVDVPEDDGLLPDDEEDIRPMFTQCFSMLTDTQMSPSQRQGLASPMRHSQHSALTPERSNGAGQKRKPVSVSPSPSFKRPRPEPHAADAERSPLGTRRSPRLSHPAGDAHLADTQRSPLGARRSPRLSHPAGDARMDAVAHSMGSPRSPAKGSARKAHGTPTRDLIAAHDRATSPRLLGPSSSSLSDPSPKTNKPVRHTRLTTQLTPIAHSTPGGETTPLGDEHMRRLSGSVPATHSQGSVNSKQGATPALWSGSPTIGKFTLFGSDPAKAGQSQSLSGASGGLATQSSQTQSSKGGDTPYPLSGVLAANSQGLTRKSQHFSLFRTPSSLLLPSGARAPSSNERQTQSSAHDSADRGANRSSGSQAYGTSPSLLDRSFELRHRSGVPARNQASKSMTTEATATQQETARSQSSYPKSADELPSLQNLVSFVKDYFRNLVFDA